MKSRRFEKKKMPVLWNLITRITVSMMRGGMVVRKKILGTSRSSKIGNIVPAPPKERIAHAFGTDSPPGSSKVKVTHVYEAKQT